MSAECCDRQPIQLDSNSQPLDRSAPPPTHRAAAGPARGCLPPAHPVTIRLRRLFASAPAL